MITGYCESAGKLSTTLFLSLFVLSGGAVAAGRQQHQSPLLPALPPQTLPKDSVSQQQDAVLDFVSFDAFCEVYRG